MFPLPKSWIVRQVTSGVMLGGPTEFWLAFGNWTTTHIHHCNWNERQIHWANLTWFLCNSSLGNSCIGFVFPRRLGELSAACLAYGETPDCEPTTNKRFGLLFFGVDIIFFVPKDINRFDQSKKNVDYMQINPLPSSETTYHDCSSMTFHQLKQCSSFQVNGRSMNSTPNNV